MIAAVHIIRQQNLLSLLSSLWFPALLFPPSTPLTTTELDLVSLVHPWTGFRLQAFLAPSSLWLSWPCSLMSPIRWSGPQPASQLRVAGGNYLRMSSDEQLHRLYLHPLIPTHWSDAACPKPIARSVVPWLCHQHQFWGCTHKTLTWSSRGGGEHVCGNSVHTYIH